MSSNTVSNYKPTKFQTYVQQKVGSGKSLLLIAPTGLGKTFAVVGDIQQSFRKTIYAAPLRALVADVRKEISELRRNGKRIEPVVHHGDLQESMLFGEEVVVTTYDQVVCGAAGLPLSLPLKAGHAVAGAILMSRLVLDEVHLAWGISDQALPILLGIVDFRRKLGLQTIVLTATLPKKVAELICQRLDLELVIVGEGDTVGDEGLELREKNRQVTTSLLELKTKGKGKEREVDYSLLDDRLRDPSHKRIYFANTVERIQQTYDRLIPKMDYHKIVVLHNRMPRSWRTEAEGKVRELFGKDSVDGDWLLLTNQVAEAGLNISAPVVISDPAPVDTLIQRAGRCARWFRYGKCQGEFIVLSTTKNEMEDKKAGLALPYRAELVQAALNSFSAGDLGWASEKDWINRAWGDGPEKAQESVARSLEETTFALNLFDRAAQQRRPGEIARAFRDILSIEVAVYDASTDETKGLQDLQHKLAGNQYPETSSVSMARGWGLFNEAKGRARVIRYEEGQIQIVTPQYLQTGDILVVPSTVAFLDKAKGLCFGDAGSAKNAILRSEWGELPKRANTKTHEGSRYQTLLDHATAVMKGTYARLTCEGSYREALVNILQKLEPQKDTDRLANAIAHIAVLAAGFHDLGKADERWQTRAREIDPGCPDGLIGRTGNQAEFIGIKHSPPGFHACLRACELMGLPPSARHLEAAIALASIRHHSSLVNPAAYDEFRPSPLATDLVVNILQELGNSEEAGEMVNKANDILSAARQKPPPEWIPLLLPNEDLFPIYALVGRAILMADREDAAGRELEEWRVTPP